MGELSKTAATLRFFGDDLDPGEITSALGQSPTVGVPKGGVWLTFGGVERRAKTGSWRRTTERREPGDLDGHIAELLDPLTQDLDVWRSLTKRFQADIFCGLFLSSGNEGVSLLPSTLAAVGSRGLILDLDIYDAECG